MANTAGLPTYDAYRLKGLTTNYPTSGMKLALFLASATITPATTAYTTTGEATGTNYTAGGVALTTGTAPTISSNTGIWTPTASASWSTVTLSSAVDCGMAYDTGDSNSNKGVFTWGSFTITAANLTLTMPTHNSSTALARWAFS